MRGIGIVGAIALFVGFAVLSVALFVVDWRPWHLIDMVWMNLLGILFGGALLRVADIQARPDRTGLTVRNIVRTRHVKWSETVGVPSSLDLADGSTCAVMAIQHADGPRAHEEVARLRMLVTKWTNFEEDQP